VKIVLDTNVFVSGIFFTGPPYRILGAWRDRTLELVLSPEILDEYRRVGSELSIKYPSVDIKPFLTLVAQEGLMIAPEPLPDPVCADADDDKFIACALAAACDIVVSGDRHLLKVSGFRGISVLTPREFVRRHLEGSV
jgi:putative PIN family toxin of toxin-antitoxin system